MNASLSDGNEPVIDIFILSANSLLSTQLEKQLGDEGYVVTLFSDGTHLLETLRNGKPNLLMCDSTVPDADAFEVCRQIKADDFLWNIPVLLMTGAADLGDLLKVLDCNADNFIAYPFDPPYLISLIEGMLTVPVERQTPEQIKTQFKIRHDDQVFVVTADRRKLLEFLLSSFEIAVNKSTDLYRAQENIQNLGLANKKLEESVHENTRVIGIINETLKTREQKLAELTGQLSAREQTVREKNAALDQLSRDLSLEKSAHAEALSEFGRINKETDETLADNRSTIEQLQQQVTDLSSELAVLRPALERTKEELLGESSLRQTTENDLSTTTTQRDQAEKALGALTTEYEQLKINFGAEKNRAQEAEQELKAVLQAKTQSEQDLTQIITDLKTTATQQAAAFTRFKEETASEMTRHQEELEAERARLRQTEENLNALTAAKEQSEASLQGTIDAGREDLASLQARFDTARSRIEEREQAITTLNEQIAAVSSAQKSAEQELAAVSHTLDETKTALEAETQNNAAQKEDLAKIRAEKEKAESLATSLAGSLKELQDQLEQEKGRYRDNEERLNMVIQQRDRELGELGRVHEEAVTAVSSHKTSLEELQRDFAEVSAEKEKAESLAASLAGSLKELQDQLEQEKGRYRDNEERLNMVIQQRDRELGELGRVHEETVTAVSSHKTSLEELQRDFAEVSAEKEKAESLAASLAGSLKKLQDQLEQERGRYRDNEERMNMVILQRDRELGELGRVHEEAQTEAALHKTSLEQLQRDLDSTVSARTDLAEKLHLAEVRIHDISHEVESASEGREQEKQQISSLAGELERARARLEQEIVRRQESEDQLRDALSQQQQLEQDLERLVSETKALHTDLIAERRIHEIANQKNQSLEEQVSVLVREKLEAEKAAADLTAEIDQARVALADEWEDHMTDNERLEEVAAKKQQPAPAPFSEVRREAEIIKKRSLIVKGPIPAETRPLPRPVAAIDPATVSESETMHITSVEDLFEDDEDEGEKPTGEPVVSIIQEPATEPLVDVLPDSIPGRSDEQDLFSDDETPTLSDTRETKEKDEIDEEEGEREPTGTASVAGQHVTFNRAQWLDLLKWSRHCEDLTQDQRMQIVRMGRLIQKGRKLTKNQGEQVQEMIALVQRLGYRIP